jgi:membrane associated rhomboid family serine protease
MNELDARGAEVPPPRATLGLALFCVVVFLLEVATRAPIFDAGYMNFALVKDGDLHRIVTANLIHAFSLHLVFNLVCLLAIGRMLERAIGSARLLCVMGGSALGAMVACAWVRDAPVVGVSGVVFGLMAGLLWVELRCATSLPVWWRIPRRMLFLVCGGLLIDAGLGFVIPIIAGEAHLGGFAAGLLTTALVTPRSLGEPSRSVRLGGRAVIAATAAAVLVTVATLAAPGDFEARHALRVMNLPGVSPEELNNRAWVLATVPDTTPERLSVALRLAERAVEESQHRDATILDTLAEVQFLLGDPARATDEKYYREQRRRVLGERARDDRPDPPLPAPPWRGPRPSERDPAPAGEDGGVTV